MGHSLNRSKNVTKLVSGLGRSPKATALEVIDALASLLLNQLNYTAFTLVCADFFTIVRKGTNIVNGFDPFVKGVITKN